MSDTLSQPGLPHSPGSEAASPEVKKAIIEQLAKEIQASADHLMSLRTRTAFTIWVGPYVVLGSVIVATKGGFTLDVHSPLFALGLLIAVGCYLALGYLAGRIEKFSLERSNQWRRCIIQVAETGRVDPALYLDHELPSAIIRAYLTIFTILLFCFFGVAVIVTTIQSKPESATSVVSQPAQTGVAVQK